MDWKIGDKHKIYGEVVSMACLEGEPYRFFKSKDGSIAMMPLSSLKINGELR